MSDKNPDETPDKTPDKTPDPVEDPNQEWISYVNPETGERERVTLDHYRTLGL